MSRTITTTILVSCLLLGGASAQADEVIITYRSGAVQKVPLLEPTEQIQQISYRKQVPPEQSPAAATQPVEAPQKAGPHQQPAAVAPQPTTPKAPQPKTEDGKAPFKLKWAQPRDAW